LREKYPSILFVEGNIKNRSDCQSWVRTTLNRFGKIDNLVNNAAITGPCGKLEELDFAEFEETIQINFLAPIFMTKELLPHFIERKSGAVVNLSGGGATAPRPHFGAYGASKCALVRFTESLSLEYPQLHFYSVAPGALKTPMMEGISKISAEKIGKEQEEAAHRMKVGGDDPAKAAQLIKWLCEQRPEALKGKLISAKWDDYLNPPNQTTTVPFWTLRRVDAALLPELKKSEAHL